MTPDQIVAQIMAQKPKFLVTQAAKATGEGLYVRDLGNDQFKLQYLSASGEPKRIPAEVRSVVGIALSALAPGTLWKNLDITDYARSNDGQRRVDTMRSILRSALTADQQPTKVMVPGVGPTDPPKPVSTAKLVNIETWGGEFPERPTLASVDQINVNNLPGLPKFVSFVRLEADKAVRTIILSEAPVGPDGKRADIVSIHYELSESERKLVEQGKLLREMPAEARVMTNATIHVGDVNRPLGPEGQTEHFAKSVAYVELVLTDLLTKFRGEAFKLKGKIRISIIDSYLHSVGYVFDFGKGTLKPARDAAPVAPPQSEALGPQEIPVDGAPTDPNQRLKAMRVELETVLQEAKDGTGEAKLEVGGRVAWVRGGPLPIVKDLTAAMAELPEPVRKNITSIVQLLEETAKSK